MQNVILKGDIVAYRFPKERESVTTFVTAMAIEWEYVTGIGTVYVKIVGSSFWHKTTAKPFEIRNIVNRPGGHVHLDGVTKE